MDEEFLDLYSRNGVLPSGDGNRVVWLHAACPDREACWGLD
ncbi:MAG: hypothetical protein U1D55_17170 [Phycisphaerae bacterium]